MEMTWKLFSLTSSLCSLSLTHTHTNGIDPLKSPVLWINKLTFFSVRLYTELLSKQGQLQVCWEHTHTHIHTHTHTRCWLETALWCIDKIGLCWMNPDLQITNRTVRWTRGGVMWLALSIWNLIYWHSFCTIPPLTTENMSRAGAFRENWFTSEMGKTLLLQTAPLWESCHVLLNFVLFLCPQMGKIFGFFP